MRVTSCVPCVPEETKGYSLHDKLASLLYFSSYVLANQLCKNIFSYTFKLLKIQAMSASNVSERNKYIPLNYT